MTAPYILYGAQISYFTGKLRAYLQWKDIPFEEIAADGQVYRQVIVPEVGFPVIPVLRTPAGQLLQDTTEIIDALEAAHPQPTIRPPGPVQRFVALLLELHADEWLLIPAMHYRWHHNRAWAMRAFGELAAPQASPEEQLAVGQRIAVPFADAAVLLGAEPAMHAAVEASYEGLLAELDAHFQAAPCVLGARPCIADFALYGPLYAHLYRDPASGVLMRERAPHLAGWVERMRDGAVSREGAFPADDAVPPTLLPVLRRMAREQGPVLADTVHRLRAWMAEHPGTARVPRALGKHAFELEGAQGRRIVRPYSLWMLQRARDAYEDLSPDARMRADQLLAAAGFEAFAALPKAPRVERDGLSVALA